MLQYISGKEIADEQEIVQRAQVQLFEKKGIVPRLAIIQTVSSSVIDTYVRLKKKYSEQIGVEVVHYNIVPEEVETTITFLNNDPEIHGIIVQLPLDPSLNQDTVLNLVAKNKDVDGLTKESLFVPPTVQAILWLLEKYVTDLSHKKIALVGKGRLVGAPLERELLKRDITARVFTKEDSLDDLYNFEVIISATGVPNLLTNIHIQSAAYVLDAGTAEENGAIHGDAADELYNRDDISITPTKGGVGILTVRALFENTLLACEKNIL